MNLSEKKTLINKFLPKICENSDALGHLKLIDDIGNVTLQDLLRTNISRNIKVMDE